MWLETQCVRGVQYLRVMEYADVQTEDGTYKKRRRCVKSLGRLSKHDDGLPNYMQRLRESFKAGHPIIPELAEYSAMQAELEKRPRSERRRRAEDEDEMETEVGLRSEEASEPDEADDGNES